MQSTKKHFSMKMNLPISGLLTSALVFLYPIVSTAKAEKIVIETSFEEPDERIFAWAFDDPRLIEIHD